MSDNKIFGGFTKFFKSGIIVHRCGLIEPFDGRLKAIHRKSNMRVCINTPSSGQFLADKGGTSWRIDWPQAG
jgi:hypothetical protein